MCWSTRPQACRSVTLLSTYGRGPQRSRHCAAPLRGRTSPFGCRLCRCPQPHRSAFVIAGNGIRRRCGRSESGRFIAVGGVEFRFGRMVVVAALVAQLRAQREAAAVAVVAVHMVAMAVAARHGALMRAVVVERVRAVAAYGKRSRADRRQQVCRQQRQGHQGASYGSVALHCRCVYGTKVQIFC